MRSNLNMSSGGGGCAGEDGVEPCMVRSPPVDRMTDRQTRSKTLPPLAGGNNTIFK